MEPEVRAFLLLIVQTLSMGMLWLLVNMTAGIYYNLGFFENNIHWYNVLYYVFFLASLFLLIRYFLRKWRGFKELDEE